MKHTQAWRFANECGDGVVQWRMRRNCSVRPGQLLAILLMLMAVSLAIAAFFWWQGAYLVLPFTVLELTALVVAFVVYARHATDGEVVSLGEDGLSVECEVAGVTTLERFEPALVRVGVPEKPGELIEIRAGRREMRVGRYLRPEWRRAVGREIRRAVAGTGMGNP